MLSHAQLCWHILNLDLHYEATIAAASAYLDSFGPANQYPEMNGAAVGASLLTTARQDGRRDLRAVHAEIDATAQRHLLIQCAPHALLTGCTLQNFNHAGNCHEAVPALVHSVHSWQVGAGRMERNAANQYRGLLEQLGIHLPPIRSSRFDECAETCPAAWELAAYQLSLSLFPESRRGELLGAALFDLTAGIDQLQLPAPLDAVVHASGYARVRAGAPRDAATEALLRALEQEVAAHGNAGAIVHGFTTAMTLYGRLLEVLAAYLGAGASRATDEMVRLIERKARYAVGYHGKLKLGGMPFEELLMSDAGAFVEQLGRSRWVKPGAPEASLLLTKLSSFGGPMYRVFSEDETAVIAAWIRSLGTGDTVPARPPATTPALAAVLPATKPQRAEVLDARTLYHRLLSKEHCPRLRAAALGYVDTWFGRSAARLSSKPEDMPFREYSHARLRQWFEREALDQAGSYVDRPQGQGKTREDVIDEAMQLCPMVFIDGAWLQKWGNAGLAETPVGAILYKIFSDEIGNGSVVENHPNIYRTLMDEMQTNLPDFRSEEFAFSERFDDDSFATPAFWLCLSQFPLRFVPETLGINLAMELSGVGSAYRTAKDELKHHGFSTLFVELHNTIDNVSSGHSAMAIEAIEHYMDGIAALHDPRLVAQNWERVWIGYRSLSKPERHWTEMLRKPRYLAAAF